MITIKKVTKIETAKRSPSDNRKLRVAAYARVSTDSDAQLESLEAQKSHYESYIRSRDDWEFAGLYYDEGITGTKAEKRPELKRLMADCEMKKIDYIVTKSISRFSRNTTDCLDLVRNLLNLGIAIYFEKENLDTASMESELFLSILSSMAEGESQSISQNSKWAIQKRFQNGTFKLSSPPYGYDWDGENMVINPEQAEIVKRIFSETLSGRGSQAIANKLNCEGIPSKRDGRWTASTIRGILENEKYTGDVIYQKTFTDSQYNRHKNRGQRNQYLETEHHDAIISHEEFEAAAAIITQHAAEKGIQKGARKYLSRYPFSGKIICGECGNTFKRRIHTCKGYKYAAWCCTTHLDDKEKCSMLYVREDDLQLTFTTMLNKLIFGHRMVLGGYFQALQENTADKGILKLQQLEALIEQNAEQRETLKKLMSQGYINQVLFTKETNELLSQLSELEAEIEFTQNSLDCESSKITETQELLHFCQRGSMMSSFNNVLFDKFVDHIRVDNRHQVSFILKCDLTFTERIGD